MNTKIWIGDDKELRKKVLSLIDIKKYGGSIYFKGCTSIFFYQDKVSGFDIRTMSDEKDSERFKKHKNKEIKFSV